MTRIIQLEINNFRGIKHITLNFKPDKNLICFIGRGDSGKTTVLEAISSVLSPNWNLNFFDTDFHNCDISKNIEIIASIIEFPESFLVEDKFGLYIRGFDLHKNKIIDDFTEDDLNDHMIPVLSIKLSIDSTLEPQWVVTNERVPEDKPISRFERSHLNCYLISDYVDSHFSWNKGNPLYALYKSINLQDALLNENIIIQCLRDAKIEIDKNGFENLNEATNIVKDQAAILGLNITETKTTLDSRELSIKDGRICLHENLVPFRLKGKGTKRLTSIAIQSAIVKMGGIMLIDEIEQGQEPDRIKQAVRSFSENQLGQIFISTHSRDAICELGPDPLLLVIKNDSTDETIAKQLNSTNDNFAGTVRACPEAFFAKKVIVCEGATEVGICRAIDQWRILKNQQPMSFTDCEFINGTGSNLEERVDDICEVGLNTALLCDSDCDKINDRKEDWIRKGVLIFDCEKGLCFEKQLFQDLPWNAILELIDYVINVHYKKNEDGFQASIQAKLPNGFQFPKDWRNSDSIELRDAISKASIVKKNEWFKTVREGEIVGNLIFKHFNNIEKDRQLKRIFNGLSMWIDS